MDACRSTRTPGPLEVVDGVASFRPHGTYSLVEAVALASSAIAYCRDRGVTRLLIDATALTGVAIPSLVDRFLMVEEWAHQASGVVIVVLVTSPEYIHPEKFGVKVALDFGLVCDVYPDEEAARTWLRNLDLERSLANADAVPARISFQEVAMSNVKSLHDAVKRGDVDRIRALLAAEPGLVSARSETDPRGTTPLHVAAEADQSAAAQALLDHGATDSLLDQENGATALSWAAFFGHPKVVEVLLRSGSDPSQRNKHGLTPLGCAVGGANGQWQDFSDASLADWERCAEIVRSHGGVE